MRPTNRIRRNQRPNSVTLEHLQIRLNQRAIARRDAANWLDALLAGVTVEPHPHGNTHPYITTSQGVSA